MKNGIFKARTLHQPSHTRHQHTHIPTALRATPPTALRTRRTRHDRYIAHRSTATGIEYGRRRRISTGLVTMWLRAPCLQRGALFLWVVSDTSRDVHTSTHTLCTSRRDVGMQHARIGGVRTVLAAWAPGGECAARDSAHECNRRTRLHRRTARALRGADRMRHGRRPVRGGIRHPRAAQMCPALPPTWRTTARKAHAAECEAR